MCVILCGVFSPISYATDDATYFDYYNEGYLLPSPDFPNRESLPYGDDTCVYDFPFYSGTSNIGVFRVYIKRDLYSGSGVSAYNGASTVFVDNESGTYPAFEILFTSPNIIYTQTYYYNGSGSVTSWGSVSQSPYVKQKDGKTYNFGVKTGNVSGSTRVSGYYSGSIISTDPCYYGGRDLKSLLDAGIFSNAPADERPAYSSTYYLRSASKSYPTSNDISSKSLSDSIDESNTQVIAEIKAQSEAQITAIDNASKEITGAIEANGEKLDDINGSVQENGEKLDNIEAEVKSLPEKIIDGIKGLFIPSEEAMISIRDKWDALMAERFGALYQAGSFISDFAENFRNYGTKRYLSFPEVTVTLAGTEFSFGGWSNVSMIPLKFQTIIDNYLKPIIGIVATFAFVVMLRNKFDKIVGDNT